MRAAKRFKNVNCNILRFQSVNITSLLCCLRSFPAISKAALAFCTAFLIIVLPFRERGQSLFNGCEGEGDLRVVVRLGIAP